MLKYFHFIPESFLALLVSFSNWFLEFPIKRLYCVGKEGPTLSCSCWFITFIKRLVMGQMWCANTLSLSSQLAPRVQYARPVFVRAEWHSDLWSVKPPCLWRIPAFTSVFPVFNSVAWWHTVPVSPEMVLGPCGKERRVGPPFGKKGNKAMNEKSEQKGKLSHCASSVWHPLYQTLRRPCRALFRGEGTSHSTPVQSCSSQKESQLTILAFLKLTFYS